MPPEQNPTPPTPLTVQHCPDCTRWVHPATGDCPACGSALVPRPVSGRGTVFSYTVNHHRFNPELPVPYVIALVELAEQDGLRLAANIVDCEPDSVTCGMAVQARVDGDTAVFVPA